MMDFDATIVGAGPFGLSTAAYLKDKKLGVGIFGDPHELLAESHARRHVSPFQLGCFAYLRSARQANVGSL
jgi:thioredoxin reductase